MARPFDNLARRALLPCALAGLAGALSAREVAAQVAPEQAAPAPQAPEGGEDGDAAEAEAPAALEPPRLLRSAPPVYPPERVGDGQHPTVVVRVTLNDHGDVVDAQVESPGDPLFDDAAVAAVRSWQFAPALRDGRPIASRIRVAVHFELPSFELTPGAGRPPPAPSAVPASPPATPPAQPSPDFGAQAQAALPVLRERERGASDLTLGRGVLEAAPRAEGAEALRAAPGVFVARTEGDAVGHRIMLRGFDAEHGQDLELSVGGVPINLPSHIHGQGYADLGFLIGEVVDELRVTEGVYDPRQGDFAVAGSIDLSLALPPRDPATGVLRARSSAGSFGTFRQALLWAPAGQPRGTFGAAQLKRSDGFGQGRRSLLGSAIAQVEVRDGSLRYRALGIVYGARAGLAGVLRRDDIDAGKVGFYDHYPLPTAAQQSAQTGRVLLGASVEQRGAREQNADFGVWLSADSFRLQQNFTGFTQSSRVLPGVRGRGDLIEQRNGTTSLGVRARYRSPDSQPWPWLRGQAEVGVAARFDQIEQSQNLLEAVRNQTWDRRVDAQIRAVDVGLWGELLGHVGGWLDLRAGVRADVLSYEVDDRLGNFVPAERALGDSLVGFRRSAQGLAVGPRASARLAPLSWLSVLAAYGEGYRSPQARTLADGEQAPFTKVRSADLGLRAQDKAGRFELTLAGYWTHLSDDVAFEAREGRLERIGESRRLGGMLRGSLRWRFLTAAASLTYVDAELLEPPPPTADDPDPVFEEGQNLPFVPPWVARLDLSAGRALGRTGGRRWIGKLGLGYTYLSPRPLPFGDFAEPVSLLDASLSVGWRPLTLGVEVFNLLDSRYAAAEYNFVSSWDPDAPMSRTPARHIAAGAPRTLMVTLEVSL